MEVHSTLRCPSCGHENRRDRRFCTECGGGLRRACEACGAVVEPSEKFCGNCGAALREDAAVPRRTEAPLPAPDAAAGERRQLTVLFCDLVGSTPLSQQLDAEDFWREIIARYQQAVTSAVARFGGHVARKLGDGLLIYFGWPTAREDDPERAVRAGLAIVDAMGPLNAALAAGDGPRLAVRIGLHTGPVVIADDGEVFGETANVAARVQGEAEPDTVVITTATQRLVAGMFVVEDRGPQLLKGVREPVTLYRVVQPSGVRSRFHARATQGLAPFVGRDEERQLLRQRFEQAREGEGHVVLLVGEPGIGKSRLAQVLHEELAGTPHTWLESGGAPYLANTPFYAVTELLNQFLTEAAASEPETRVGALARALEAAGLQPTEAVPLVAPLLDLPLPEGYPPVLAAPEVARKRLLATLAAWVFAAARRQPTVILLEDLHWVDPSTLELQQLLVEQCATVPLLLLYTARPEFLPPWTPRAHHAQLTLNRLQRRYARELVTHVAAGKALPAEVIDAVVARTDGVPLFIEELTTAVVEAGTTAGARDIPATLADSLMARLDRLGAAKQVAQVGAVIGREFSYALLAAVSARPESELRAGLERLVDAELVYPRGLPPEATYLFKHALVQETAYEALLKSRRRELHRAVAQVVVERFPAQAEAEPELLARHYEAAGRIDEAIRYYQRAGERAQGRSAHEEAIGHLRKAIALIGTLPADRERDAREVAGQLVLGASLVAVRAPAHAETVAAWERARALGEALGDAATLVSALAGLSGVYVSRGEPDRGLLLAERALAVGEETRDRTLILLGHIIVAHAQTFQGRFGDALAHAERAIALYDPTCDRGKELLWGSDLGVVALGWAAQNLAYLGHADRALGRAREGVARARTLAHPYSLAWALFNETFVHIMRGDLGAALEEAAEMMALSDTQGFPAFLDYGRIFHGVARVMAGQGTATLAEVAEITVAADISRRAGLPFLLHMLALGQRAAGQHAEALGTVERGLAVAAETGVHFDDAGLHQLKGELLLATEPARAAEAEALFRRALEIARSQEAKFSELGAATSLARLLRAQGKPADARALLAPLYAWFTEGFDTGDLVEAKALLDELT